MTSGIRTVIYPVKDLAAAKTLYTKLIGVAPVMDEPYYVGFKVDGQDIGLDPNGHRQGMTGPLGYWEVEDIAERVRQLTGAGATVRQDATDVGGGKLIATLADADGNVFGLSQSP